MVVNQSSISLLTMNEEKEGVNDIFIEPVVDDASQKEDPNKVVQKENLGVQILRFFFLIILIVTGCVAIYAVYRYSATVEEEKFRTEYSAVSKAVLQSFLGDVTMKTYNGLALASLVGSHFEVKKTKPWTLDVPITRMLQGSAETRFFANSDFVAYSPFIFNNRDREEFEEYAASFEEQNGPFRAGFDLPCYSCGGPNFIVTEPTKNVEIPGFGKLFRDPIANHVFLSDASTQVLLRASFYSLTLSKVWPTTTNVHSMLI